MKNIHILIFILLALCSGCKSKKPLADKTPELVTNPVPEMVSNQAAISYSDQTTWILGYFKLNQLTSYPHSIWYIKGYDEYQINTEALNKLLDINKDDITIKIIMGTWCPDSRREVPRFMRVLDAWTFPVTQVTFIGVDNAKQSPVGEYIGLDIHRVPTFILYKKNIESGRIIENPMTSLEQDMVNILTGMTNNK